VDRYLRDYLRILRVINHDVYRQAIDRNMKRLQALLATQRLAFPGLGEFHSKWV
jgi:hypothetical protein